MAAEKAGSDLHLVAADLQLIAAKCYLGAVSSQHRADPIYPDAAASHLAPAESDLLATLSQ